MSQDNDSRNIPGEAPPGEARTPAGETPVLPADTRARVGDAYIARGQVAEALQHYREAVRSSDATEHRVRLGDAYAYSGQGLNAYRQYRRAIKTSPRKAEPHFALAELFHRYGRLQSA